MRRKNLRTVVVLALTLVCALSCSRSDKREIRRVFPKLSPDVVDVLAANDDSALASYSRSVGYDSFIDTLEYHIIQRVGALLLAHSDRDAEIAIRCASSLSGMLAAEYNDSSSLRWLVFIQSLPRDRRDEHVRRMREYEAVRSGPKMPAEEALATCRRFLRAFQAVGDSAWAALANADISAVQYELGHDDEGLKHLRAACSGFAAAGNRRMTSELWGTLGFRYRNAGQIDSMFACYERALEVARGSRMATQAARILTFYAAYYGVQGRLDLRRQLLNESVETCRRYKGRCAEIRFLHGAMLFHADLGCWDVVEDLLRQAHGLEPQCGDLRTAHFDIYPLRISEIEARLGMARGNVARGDSIFKDIIRSLPKLRLPYDYRAEDDKWSFYLADGLLANGRDGEALAEARKALSVAPAETAPDWTARLSLVMAKAAFRLNDLAAVETALAQFDSLSSGQEGVLRLELTERDALAARIRFASGDEQGGIEALDAGLRRLEQTAAGIDASVGSYLWLGERGDLHELLQDVASKDPLIGYGAELWWRELDGLLGSRARVAAAKTAVAAGTPRTKKLHLDDFREKGEAALSRVSRAGGVHCLYAIRPNEIWRWTASGGGFRKDVIDATPAALSALVGKTLEMLSTYPVDPDALPERDLRDNLRTLAHLLLPREVFDENAAQSPTTFYVTGDGFLASIPFEAFDIGEGADYEPLLSRFDVAYVRYANRDGERRARGTGLIFVNSRPSTAPAGQYRAQVTLSEVEAEGQAVAAIDPSAVVISGDAGTKKRLTSLWENAPYIYMATHVIRSPEIPYLTMIPVTPPPGESAPDQSVIDITDIRAADFGRCGIVVLSGCSSGAPYVTGSTSGPSLGDAFLDAGAKSVVQTFWDVRDEDARRLMTHFVETWRDARGSKVRALCEVRRRELRGPKGIRHPSCWASYAIEVARP